jgi:DNA repair exonuclease SbcCD ATPase subunit
VGPRGTNFLCPTRKTNQIESCMSAWKPDHQQQPLAGKRVVDGSDAAKASKQEKKRQSSGSDSDDETVSFIIGPRGTSKKEQDGSVSWSSSIASKKRTFTKASKSQSGDQESDGEDGDATAPPKKRPTKRLRTTSPTAASAATSVAAAAATPKAPRQTFRQQFLFSQQEVRSLTEAQTKLQTDLEHERQSNRRLTDELKRARRSIDDLQAKWEQAKEEHASFLKEQFQKAQQSQQTVHQSYTSSLEQQRQDAMSMLKQSLHRQHEQVKTITAAVTQLSKQTLPRRPRQQDILYRVEQMKVKHEQEKKTKVTAAEFQRECQRQFLEAQTQYQTDRTKIAGLLTSQRTLVEETKRNILAAQLSSSSSSDDPSIPSLSLSSALSASSTPAVRLLQTLADAERVLQQVHSAIDDDAAPTSASNTALVLVQQPRVSEPT